MKKPRATLPIPEPAPITVAEVQRLISKLRLEYAEQRVRDEQIILHLKEENRALRALLYGRSSEKRGPAETDQRQPFLPFDDEIQPIAPPTEKPQNVKAHHRRKPGRKPLSPDLPRIDEIHDLTEGEKVCACGAELTRIGEEVTERLDVVPAKAQVIRHVRCKYACRQCEGIESKGGAVKLAPLPAQVIPQGIVTANTLAHIVVAKFADALPLYRQEQQFARMGAGVSRKTLVAWLLFLAEALLPLRELLQQEVISGPLANMDETPVQVMREPGRSNTTLSYMWVLRGGPPGRVSILFRYFPTRSGKAADEILRGFRGYLHTDGYVGYELLGHREEIRQLGCWAHVRRKFREVVKNALTSDKKGIADQAMTLIGALYAVEDEGKELADNERVALRREKSQPILTRFKDLIDTRSLTTPPSSLLGKAINYALNQWPRLTIFLEQGFLRLDNNLAENAIRPFAVGRKNWLFAGSPRGAEASATFFSLLETAKANGLEPYAYFQFLFRELPSAKTDPERRALLPQYVDRNQLTK